ncbi:MAG: AI-2E family transporter, partial [Hyphomicrobiaceae bacterium]
IFALFAFSYLFGFVGTLIAVPVSAALAVVVRFAFARYLESDVYKGTVVANTGVAEAQGSKHSR